MVLEISKGYRKVWPLGNPSHEKNGRFIQRNPTGGRKLAQPNRRICESATLATT
jgi:hypothetical protein